MLKDASNIFFPQFVLRERPRALQQTIESWCDANRIEETSIAAVKNLVIDLEVRWGRRRLHMMCFHVNDFRL